MLLTNATTPTSGQARCIASPTTRVHHRTAAWCVVPHAPGDTMASDALRVVPRVEARLAAGAAAAVAVDGVSAAAMDARVHMRAGRAAAVGGVATAAAAAGDSVSSVQVTTGEALWRMFSLSLSCTPLSGDALRAVGRGPFLADGRNLSALQQQTSPPATGSLAPSSATKLVRLSGCTAAYSLSLPSGALSLQLRVAEGLVRNCSRLVSPTVVAPGAVDRQQTGANCGCMHQSHAACVAAAGGCPGVHSTTGCSQVVGPPTIAADDVRRE
jgi:hypothetical protein